MRFLIVCLALLLPFSASAELAAVPPLQQRVTDLTHTLSAEQQASLENRLAAFEQQKGSQIAILLVPSTQPEDIAQYSIRVVEQWKLGRKGIDDGILILLAKEDRRMRIEVGYGLEGVIPDVVAKRIISDIITPYFKQGDFYGGLNAGLDRLLGLIDGEALPAPGVKQQKNQSWEDALPLLLFGGLLVGGLLRSIFGNFLGGAMNGGLIGALVWFLGGGILFALILAFIAFILTLAGFGRGFVPGGFGGGSGGFGGGGFSGGGGGFGGGGASGNW